MFPQPRFLMWFPVPVPALCKGGGNREPELWCERENRQLSE